MAQIELPTPYPVGPVNAWLIEDEPLTLVDAGPDTGTGLYALERGLRDLGHRVEDLGLIVITHQHKDHLGLARVLAARSGADVAAYAGAISYMAGADAAPQTARRFAVKTMVENGVPPAVAEALRANIAHMEGAGFTVDVTIGLSDGDTVELRDRVLEVSHRPGHSPSDIVLYDRDQGLALSGDHLLQHISSNPLLSSPLEGVPAARPQPLVDYLESLRATRDLPARAILPGHGSPFTNHAPIIDGRFAMHASRADEIYELVAECPASAHEIALRMWKHIAMQQVYLTLSEVLGHVDLLALEGRVRSEERDGVVQIVAT